MNENFIRYVGFADRPPIVHEKPWKPISDTDDALTEAINAGYTAVSTMSFEYEPDKEKPEPLRKGNLFLDFDCKGNIGRAIEASKLFVRNLATRFQIHPSCLNYWMSGGKGCHIEIPNVLYSGQDGDQYLPLIHRAMMFLLSNAFLKNTNMIDVLDMSMYDMGKGRLLRIENTPRESRHFKVPVTAEELLTSSNESLIKMTETTRYDLHKTPHTLTPSDRLTELYVTSLELVHLQVKCKNPLEGLEALL